MKRFFILLVVLGVIVGGGIFVVPHIAPQLVPYWSGDSRAELNHAEPKQEAALPPAVSIIRATQADFTEMVTVSGSLVPRDEILVAPEVEGFRVLELKVDEGDRVKKGDVLAILVQESLDAQLAQKEAMLARWQAAISQSESQIADMTAKLAEARANFERAKPLKNSGFLSGTTFDQREAAAKSAEAQLAAARGGMQARAGRKGAGRSATPRADVEAHEYRASRRRPTVLSAGVRRASAACVPAPASRCSASLPAARWNSTPRSSRPSWPR